MWSLWDNNSFLGCCPWRQQTQNSCISNHWSCSLEPASVLLGMTGWITHTCSMQMQGNLPWKHDCWAKSAAQHDHQRSMEEPQNETTLPELQHPPKFPISVGFQRAQHYMGSDPPHPRHSVVFCITLMVQVPSWSLTGMLVPGKTYLLCKQWLWGDVNGAVDYSPHGLDDNQQDGLQPRCFIHCIMWLFHVDRQS